MFIEKMEEGVKVRVQMRDVKVIGWLHGLAHQKAEQEVECEDGKTRLPNTEEIARIEALIYGAMRSILLDGDIRSVANTAEFICLQLLPHLNPYMTVYSPIREWVRDMEAEFGAKGG